MLGMHRPRSMQQSIREVLAAYTSSCWHGYGRKTGPCLGPQSDLHCICELVDAGEHPAPAVDPKAHLLGRKAPSCLQLVQDLRQIATVCATSL